MEQITSIVKLGTHQLYPHPDNPRKDIGDISEMTESVRKNGIMQNLTVIPLSALDEEPEDQPDAGNISPMSDFIVLIGHRRLAAAKAAGIKEIPCRIVSKISKREQISIMLEENMQRSDLTVFEQAQGFQMMFDFGETVETIAEKTGFSKTTVRHRMNLAKLEPELLKSKENNKEFQLSLTDLYALEQVESIETRNKILREARDSKSLVWRAQSAAREEETERVYKSVAAELEEKGLSVYPNESIWASGWVRVCNAEIKNGMQVPDVEGEDYYYAKSGSYLYIMKTESIEDKNEKSETQAQYEETKKKQQELFQNRDELRLKQRNMELRLSSFIQAIIDGDIEPVKDELLVVKELWQLLVTCEASIDVDDIPELLDIEYEDDAEDEEILSDMFDLPLPCQMMLFLFEQMQNNNNVCDYWGKYDKKNADFLNKCYNLFMRYGWTFEGDEEQMMDGTHMLYVKEDKDE